MSATLFTRSSANLHNQVLHFELKGILLRRVPAKALLGIGGLGSVIVGCMISALSLYEYSL
jgi:hypothetical protein